MSTEEHDQDQRRGEPLRAAADRDGADQERRRRADHRPPLGQRAPARARHDRRALRGRGPQDAARARRARGRRRRARRPLRRPLRHRPRACRSDWAHDPWGADVEDGVLYGRGAVDSKGTHVAMLAALEQVVASGQSRSGPINFMSDSDGEDGFRGATLMADLDVTPRVGTIFSAEATSNTGIEIAYPGISTWKVTAVGRTAHPTEPENGINAVTKMAKLVAAVDAGPARDAARHVELVRAARDRAGDPHAARRRLDDPRPLRRRRLRHVARRHDAQRGARVDRRPSCARSSRRTARSATSSRCCRWAPAACGCARARATRRPRASRRWSRPSPTCAASPARCASSTAAGSTRSS